MWFRRDIRWSGDSDHRSFILMAWNCWMEDICLKKHMVCSDNPKEAFLVWKIAPVPLSGEKFIRCASMKRYIYWYEPGKKVPIWKMKSVPHWKMTMQQANYLSLCRFRKKVSDNETGEFWNRRENQIAVEIEIRDGKSFQVSRSAWKAQN